MRTALRRERRNLSAARGRDGAETTDTVLGAAPHSHAGHAHPADAGRDAHTAATRCACGGGCPRCDGGAGPVARRRSGGSGTAAEFEAPAHVARVTRGPGERLDAASRSYFEPRYGRDLGAVRLHTGTDAARSARALDADAYTVGRHIVLGEDVRPGTPAGRGLLAHELAHVVQQDAAEVSPASGLRVGAADSALERDADLAAEAVAPAAPFPLSLSAQPAPVRVARRTSPLVQRGKTRPNCQSPSTGLPYRFTFNIQRSVFSDYIVPSAGGVFSGVLTATPVRSQLARAWVELRFFKCSRDTIESASVELPADGKEHEWQVSGLDESENQYFQVVNKSLGVRVEGHGWFV